MVDALRPLGLPQSVLESAEGSIAAALAIASELPADAAAAVAGAAQNAFIDGLSTGSLVAAAVAGIGAVVALLLLPARHAASVVESEWAEVEVEVG
jgi:DHA2 family multidrug resistance protein-like MFS transporter